MTTLSARRMPPWAWAAAFTFVGLGLALSAEAVVVGHSAPLILLVVGVTFSTLPVLLLILVAPLTSSKHMYVTLGLLTASSLFPRYAFALTNPFLAGTDAPYHYFFANELAHGHWPSGHQIQDALPMLYWVYGGVALTSHVPLELLATWVHPMLNVATVPLFFAYLNTLVRARVALLACFIYAWEFTSFFFGFEFRTQSLAVFFFAAFLALGAARGGRLGRHGPVIIALLRTSLVVAIALTAAVSAVLVTIILLAMGAAALAESKWYGTRMAGAPWTLPALLVSTTMAYMMYGASNLNDIVPYVAGVIERTLSFERLNDAHLQGVAEALYGPVVLALQWLMRLIFVGGMGLQWLRAASRGRPVALQPLVAAGCLLGLATALAPTPVPVSTGRYFEYLSPFMGLYASTFCFWALGRLRRSRWSPGGRTAIALCLCLWSISGVIKLPPGLFGLSRGTASVPYIITYSDLRNAEAVHLILPRGARECADEPTASAQFIRFGRAPQPEPTVKALVQCAHRAGRRANSRAVAAVHLAVLPGAARGLETAGYRLMYSSGTFRVFVHPAWLRARREPPVRWR